MMFQLFLHLEKRSRIVVGQLFVVFLRLSTPTTFFVRSFVAPTALTVFTGSEESPNALCSINLEAKQGRRRTDMTCEGKEKRLPALGKLWNEGPLMFFCLLFDRE